MIRTTRRIMCCAAGLFLVCIVCRLVFFRSFTMTIPLQGIDIGAEQVQLVTDRTDIIRIGEREIRDGTIRVQIIPERSGTDWLTVRVPEAEWVYGFRVDPFLMVYETASGSFTGDTVALLAVTLFWLLTGFITLRDLIRLKGQALCSYAAIWDAGVFLFSAANFLTMAVASARHLISPAFFSMLSVYSVINSASWQFVLLTMPVVLVFAAAMIVSNIVLLRHQKTRLQNTLALLVGVLMIAGEVLGWVLFTRYFEGSEWELRVQNTIQNVASTAFAYFLCMLGGAVIGGLRAAAHKPDLNQDFIIILGCWFRSDGSLPPLLRGRVDRALELWRQQKESTGKEAVLVPSGGQGPDESMPEAEAMRRYLLDQGVPERCILVEDRSRNTWQNMSFSRELIEGRKPDARTVFATTNYHVFRSGIWAAEANLRAEGIGSKTRWWYWPNAFMRECAGILRKRWIQEALLLIGSAVFYGVLSMTLI